MADLARIARLGDATADTVLRDLIAAFEATFPGRVAAYFLEGSWADGTKLPTGDLDLTIVFRGDSIAADERSQAAELAAQHAAASSLELDCEIADEQTLAKNMTPAFKLGGVLLYGEDVRAAMPLMPLEQWTWERMHTSYWRIVKLFGRPPLVRLPLTFPDPHDEFYGYTRRMTRTAGGGEAPGTRDLIRMVSWAATARIAYESGRYVARKADCLPVYEEAIGDRWTGLLADLFGWCRDTWHYMVPNAVGERELLRDICRRTLDFENDFFQIYRRYLLEVLADGGDEAKRQATWVLGEMPFGDDEIISALQQLAGAQDEDLRRRVARALERLPALLSGLRVGYVK